MNQLKYIAFSVLFLLVGGVNAQDVTTVEAKNSDISENLDLEAVASVFGEAKDLEDFEKRLNDPDTQISNLDLNEDNEVDYLRVVEAAKDDTHVVTIQAVVGPDQYQDVATVDVEKDDKGATKVQVVGDVNLYGANYIIEPVYVRPPVIFAWFWGVHYVRWHSPYYWHHYPHHWHYWHPHPVHHYHRHVHVHVNVHHTYHHVHVRHSHHAVQIQKTVHRNDYYVHHSSKTFAHRHHGYSNAYDMKVAKNGKVKVSGNNVKRSSVNGAAVNTSGKKSEVQMKRTGKQVQKDWKAKSQSEKKATVQKASQNKSVNSAKVKSTGKQVQNNWQSKSQGEKDKAVKAAKQKKSTVKSNKAAKSSTKARTTSKAKSKKSFWSFKRNKS